MPKVTNIEIAKHVIGAGLVICRRYGKADKVEWASGSGPFPITSCEFKTLKFVLTDPKSNLPGASAQNGLDIWDMSLKIHGQKVFSA